MKLIIGRIIVNKKRLIFSKKTTGHRCPNTPGTGVKSQTLFSFFQVLLQILTHLFKDIFPETVQRHGIGNFV